MPEEMRERINAMNLDQIAARIAEIDAEVRSLNDPAEIDARTEELRELQARKAELDAAVARATEARGIQDGTVATNIIEERGTIMPPVENRVYDASSPEYRTAFLKNVAIDSDGRHMFGEMTAEERGAFTFTTANSGNVVPTTMLNKIVDRVRSMSPIVDDSEQTGVEGVFCYPIRTAIAQGDATGVSEGGKNDDEQDTFDLATLTGVDINKHATLTRRMTFQSIDAFEDWLVADISKRIAVAKEKTAIARLDGSAPAGGSANAKVQIDSGNILTDMPATDATLRHIMSLIDEDGEVVIYANSSTIWDTLAGITDAEGKKVMIPNSMVDPVVQGRIYGASIKKDSNLSDGVAYFGVKGSLKTNEFGPMEIFPAIEPKTANRIYTGIVTFDAGLENTVAFVKVTFAEES